MTQNVNLKVRPIDKDAPGFLPRYRQIMAARRVFTEPDKGLPEDVDKAYELLMEHITEPENRIEKQRELDKLTGTQLMEILNAIMGVNTVPPANGAG